MRSISNSCLVKLSWDVKTSMERISLSWALEMDKTIVIQSVFVSIIAKTNAPILLKHRKFKRETNFQTIIFNFQKNFKAFSVFLCCFIRDRDRLRVKFIKTGKKFNLTLIESDHLTWQVFARIQFQALLIDYNMIFFTSFTKIGEKWF